MGIDEKIEILCPSLDEEKVSIYKEQGASLIRHYLNVKDSTELIIKKYESALLQIIYNVVEGSKINNIKQMSQGSKNITYVDSKAFMVTEDVKSLLPAPFVKLMG